MKALPEALIIALLVQVSCQIFKIVYYSLKDGRLNLRYLTTTGGIPSSHSAFVTALCVTIGFRHGFVSDMFAICAVFALIVMYDALRLRGVVQEQAKLLNRLVDRYHPEEIAGLPEMIGHTCWEILAGIAVGGTVSAVFSLLIFQ